MLGFKNRLKKNKQFSYIYKNGQAKHSKHISLIFAKTKLDDIKIGFSVSKKIGKSVTRNLVKRRLREIVRKFLPSMVKNNYIFIAKEGIETLAFGDLQTEVLTTLKKANLINEKND